jgi:integrase
MYNREATAMANAPDLRHLWNRGLGRDSRQNWYLKLPIPKPLRKHFPLTKSGNEQIAVIDSLDTGDLAVARRKRDELVVRYRHIFDRLQAGETLSPDQIKASVALDLNALADRYKAKVVAGAFTSPLTDTSLERQLEIQELHDDPSYLPLPNFDDLTGEVEKAAKSVGLSLPLDAASYNEIREALELGRRNARREIIAKMAEQEIIAKMAELDELAKLTGDKPPAAAPVIERVPVVVPPVVSTETMGQAADAWFDDMQRDPSAAVRQTTLDGHRSRVRAFVEHCGNVPLASVTRSAAADFLTKVASGERANRTTNQYATTLASVFKSARKRGRFTGENPFEDQKRKAGGESYSPFEITELQTLFESFKFEIAPKHSPESALPWVSLIAAYTGMRLEEVCQLAVTDIREQQANGATVTVIDIHNGGNNALKNAASARLVPIHSELVRAGLLRYRDSLPKDGPLFPGLQRRASKGGKIGARVGELFRDRLESLGLKRDRLCFHSFRHTVGGRLDTAAVSQTDAARVLGHTIPGMSFGIYSTGPGLKRLAAVVEEITYPGLKIPSKLSAKRPRATQGRKSLP